MVYAGITSPICLKLDSHEICNVNRNNFDSCRLHLRSGESNKKNISPIIEVVMPETSRIGETINIKVHHIVYNGCGLYGGEKTEAEGQNYTVTFYAIYKGEICTSIIPILITNYNFTPKRIGDYKFCFTSGHDGECLTRTIKILK